MTKIQTQQNKLFFLILFAGISVLAFFVIKPYLALTAMAFLITALFRPFYNRLFITTKSEWISTLISVLTVLMSILIPVLFISYVTYEQVLQFNEDIINLVDDESINSLGDIDINTGIDKANDIIRDLPGTDEEDELTEAEVARFIKDNVRPATQFLADQVLKLAGETINIVTYIIVFIILLSTLFPSQQRLIKFYQNISPLDDKIDRMYVDRVTNMGVAMIKGTFVIASLQALLSAVVLKIVGVDYIVFWALLCFFFSIIPLGSGIVTVPIGFVLMLTGNVSGGLFLILSYALVIGNIDNILRPRLVPKSAQLNPALTLLGILGGIQLFGPLGFIFGPVVMIFLTTTFDVYVKYYKE